MGGLEIESVIISQATIDTLEEIRKKIRKDLKSSSDALVKIDELIEILEGENEIAFHPDLPDPPGIGRLGSPPQKPEPEIKQTRTDPYKNVTTRSAILNLLGKSRGEPIPAKTVAQRLIGGGWGQDIKDPLASARAALSGMRLELDVTKVDNVLHYALYPVEET